MPWHILTVQRTGHCGKSGWGNLGKREEQAQREMSGTTRVRITYEELLREEAMVSEKSKGKERGARQIGKEKAKVQEHQKEGMRNEMG